MPTQDGDAPAPAVLRIKLVGANAESEIVGLGELPGKSNYFLGNDPNKWRTDIPHYAKVKYEAVYAGIDLVYYGNQGQMEHDFIVRPGADSHMIAFAMEGMRDLRLNENGDALLILEEGEVRLHKPVAYQEINGVRTMVGARFALRGRDRIGFDIAPYDNRTDLIIDPVLSYSTYFGGGGGDESRDIAVDSAGNAYLIGRPSGDFPTDGSGDSGIGIFVTKLNASGSALVYSTLFGCPPSPGEGATAVAVDGAGNAYITGVTPCPDFPTTPGAFDSTYNGPPRDVFVTKINAQGNALVYSTYLGALTMTHH